MGAEWTGPQKAKIEQLWFDDLKGKRRIEKIPYVFRYRYLCDEQGCKGHTQRIIDWELMQLYRNLANQGASPKVVQEKIKEKFLGDLCGSDKDTYFFVGNHSRYRASFMVLGVFWPPKEPVGLFSRT